MRRCRLTGYSQGAERQWHKVKMGPADPEYIRPAPTPPDPQSSPVARRGSETDSSKSRQDCWSRRGLVWRSTGCS